MISLEKFKILTPLQKLPKNVGNLGKLFFAKGSKNLPKAKNLVTLLTGRLLKPQNRTVSVVDNNSALKSSYRHLQWIIGTFKYY